MDLKNKVALITGGTHGIGAAIAHRFAADGATVCLVARNTDDCQIREAIELNGGKCILIKGDMGLEESCSAVVKKAYDHCGSIDILVHSAGAAAAGSLEGEACKVWYNAFDVHVHAAFHLSAAAVPYMKRNGEGAILFISSAAGLRGVKNALAYSVVKGAIPQFTRALAFELGDYNIRVNCVSPGVIRTRFQDFLTPEQVKKNINDRIPLHREGSPEDVADAAYMLVKNNFITGENVVIDGGMTMRIV